MEVTLQYASTEKSLAGWGFALAGAGAQHVNTATSFYQLSLPGGSLSDDPIIPFEGRVIIRRGRTGSGTAWSGGYTAFVGYRMDPVIDGRPDYTGIHYTFANAWYFLEQTPYQQKALSRDASAAAASVLFNTDLTLFQRFDDSAAFGVVKITNGEQIADILQHLIDHSGGIDGGAPFAIGSTNAADLDVPEYQVQEMTCAAAIQKCLELSPDCSLVFDYSTLPPTVTVRRRASMSPVTLALANGTDHKSVNIRRLDSLVPRTVIIYYRSVATNATSGVQYLSYAKDKYPLDGVEAGPRVLVQTIDLIGSTSLSLSAELRVRTCMASNAFSSAQRRAWWALHNPELKSTLAELGYERVSNLTMGEVTNIVADGNQTVGGVYYADGAAVSLANFPYELLDTQIADWMQLDSGTPVVGLTVRIDSRVSYDLSDKAATGAALVLHKSVRAEKLSTRIVLTNGEDGPYYYSSITAGEAVPVGLAQRVFQSLALQFEGEHIRVENQITQPVTLANTLNLSNGRAEWATMNAQIQSISEDDSTGMTTVTIGPARHLSAGDLRAIQFFNRNRRKRSPTTAQKTTGEV